MLQCRSLYTWSYGNKSIDMALQWNHENHEIGTIYEAYLFNTEFKDHQLQESLPIVGIVSL
jgi:hypothetical protein